MPARTAIRYWIPPLLWTAVIFAGSSDLLSAAHTGFWLDDVIRALIGHPLAAPQFDALHYAIRKAAHLAEYGILGALLFRAIRGDDTRWRWRWAIVAIVLTAVVASLDEWHQAFVPSRTSSPWDVLIDTVGATLAQIVIRVVLFFRS